RGGQGERRTFRVGLKALSGRFPDAVRANLDNVIKFGRFDDLTSTLLETSLEGDVTKLISRQLSKDLRSETPSLMAKWLPSENTSSRATRRVARKLRGKLGMSPKRYRKTLSTLRSRIGIVEKAMCQSEWNSI